MFKCNRCQVQFIDGVQCSVCQCRYDFPCAGITEAGYRKLGDRKNSWKCPSCKGVGVVVPPGKTSSARSPTPSDMESIALELKQVSAQIAALPALMKSVNSIQADIANLRAMRDDITDLKTIKTDVTDMKASLDFMHQTVETLSNRISVVNDEI